MPDAELIALATRELAATGLCSAEVIDGLVVRAPRAYPIYDQGYEERVEVISRYLRQFDNLAAMGRYGMFKYNNSDHSILTAMLSVENIDGAQHDVWAVNADESYHEEKPQ
jgi:protoporphyrinogen oxidase